MQRAVVNASPHVSGDPRNRLIFERAKLASVPATSGKRILRRKVGRPGPAMRQVRPLLRAIHAAGMLAKRSPIGWGILFWLLNSSLCLIPTAAVWGPEAGLSQGNK